LHGAVACAVGALFGAKKIKNDVVKRRGVSGDMIGSMVLLPLFSAMLFLGAYNKARKALNL